MDYRTTKNKRLLIELTLLKMSTIGQLTLEKKNNSQIKITSKKNQNEVVKKKSLEVDIEDSEHEDGLERKDIHEESVAKRKIRSNSFSLTEIMEDNEEKNDFPELVEKKSCSFTELEMRNFWKDYSEMMREDGKTNLYVTLSSFSPNLENERIIRLKISNDAQQKIIDENKIELLDYLRTNLQNDFVEIRTELTEEIKNNLPYTSNDKFTKMIEENPSLKILQQKLGLDPDY